MPTSGDENDELGSLDLFQDPEGFYEPDKPATFTSYSLRSGRRIELRLVGHSPLWVRHSDSSAKLFVC